MTEAPSFSNNINADEVLKGILNLGKPLPVGLTDTETICFSKMIDPKTTVDDNTMEEETNSCEEIVFTDNEEDFTHQIHGQDVKIICNSVDHSSGSSKVKIHNIVNFNWKQKYYLGRLVTVHASGNFLAYTLTVKNHGNVRVVNPKTNSRVLITSLTGQVKDLSFSHSIDQVLLACVDERGSFVVHKIVEDGSELTSHCMLSVKNTRDCAPSDYHLVFWCPYIPEEPADLMDPTASIVSKLLVVTHDNEVEVWNVASAAQKYGGQTVLSEDVSVRRIVDHVQPITAATFSPDGSALATASCDGEVKFFEVDVQDKDTTPNCLHQWKPHDGKPVSCLFFLDNLKSPQPDVQFWKCALTGADNNQELKLWSCESWNCLQTIRFEAGEGETQQPCLKAELDSSASYLLLSDINHRVVYVLQLLQNNIGGNVQVCSVAKFPVILPVLSVAIVDAQNCKFQLLGDSDHYQKHDIGEQNGDDEAHDETTVVKGVALKLFWISTKSVQESLITYQPPVLFPSNPDESLSILSQDSIAYRDRLSDLSCDIQDLLTSDGDIRKNSSFQSTTSSQFPPNLMDNSEILLTPDDFTSPTHSTTSSAILTPSSMPLPPITPSEEKKLASTPKLNLQDPIEPPLATSEEIPLARRKSSQRSSVSSPSQEVEDILGPVTVKESERNGDFVNSSSHIETEIEKDMKSLTLNSHCQDISPPSRKSGDFGAWPQAPDLNKEYKLFSQKLDANHLKEDDASLFPPKALQGVGDGVSAESDNNLLCKMQESIESLNQNIRELSVMVRQQGTQIQTVQEDLKIQNEHEKCIQLLKQSLESMEKKMCAKVDVMSAEHSNTVVKMKQLSGEREEFDRKWLEKQGNTVSQNISMVASNKMEKTIKSEFKTSLIPQISRSLDTWKDSVHQDINNKLMITEVTIRDNFSKMVKNKAFVDSIAQSVGNSIQPQLHSMCQEVFINKLSPTVERVCHNLFVQINDTFKHGINEYLQQTKSFLEQFNKQCQKSLASSVCSQIEEQNKKTSELQEQFLRTVVPTIKENIHLSLQEAFAKQNDQLAAKVKSIVAEELKLVARQHPPFLDGGSLSAMSSRAVTPVDPQIFQQQILLHLKQGHYNSAFQQALSAADLSLVMYVCQTVKPTEVFGASSPQLKLPVLLSLIHQLGTDLSTHTDLKLRYLQEAILSIDSSNPLAKDHLPNVIQPLRQKLFAYVQQNPKSANVTVVKMLLRLTEAVLS